MKIRTLLGISLGLAASSLACAADSTDSMERGAGDAVLAFCRQVYPAGESAYRSLEATLHNDRHDDRNDDRRDDRHDDHSDGWLGGLHTAAYQRAYSEVYGALESAQPDWARNACSELASRPGAGGRHD
jgi:hypothetical protein